MQKWKKASSDVLAEKSAMLWDMYVEENNSSEANLKKDRRLLPYTQTHTSSLPHFHSSILVLKFVQELNHLLPLHDEVAEPVVADTVFELIREFELPVPNSRFKILETDIGILF